MGSATKVGIAKINSIKKTWEAVARVKIGETTKEKVWNSTTVKYIANRGSLLSHQYYKIRIG